MPLNPYWTPREIAYLRSHYRLKPVEDIATHLGRSVKAVYTAAKAARLTRRHYAFPRSRSKWCRVVPQLEVSEALRPDLDELARQAELGLPLATMRVVDLS
jgi:hypothetical protein